MCVLKYVGKKMVKQKIIEDYEEYLYGPEYEEHNKRVLKKIMKLAEEGILV